MSWEATINCHGNNSITNGISEIADLLLMKLNLTDIDEIGLLEGKTGIALFLFYYSRYSNKKKYFDKALNLIYDDINRINNEPTSSSSNKLSRIGWTIKHLVECGFLGHEKLKILRDIDSLLYEGMIDDVKEGNYDLLHGSLSKGMYFMSKINKASKLYLTHLVDELEKISELNNDGDIMWKTILNPLTNSVGCNLGLSHGIASIIAFLSCVYKLNINKEKANYLLRGAVQFIFKQTLNTEKYISNFPCWVGNDEPLSPSRLAWCYGDLGIGMAIWQASKAVNDEDWEKKTIEILLHSTKRKDLTMNYVYDAALCHGASGVAHIYNRMYHFTQIEDFKESAIYWFNESFKMVFYERGRIRLKNSKQSISKDELGFLIGIAGVGLAFISAVSNIEPRWDRCLLLS